MAHSFGFCADRRTFTCLTARSRSVGASNETARYAYSREIDMQARRNTRRTDSAGVGIGMGFIRGGAVRLHGFIFDAAF